MRSLLTPEAERKMDDIFRLRHDAVRLLDLVVAEWNSDPMSVQCFDKRIVDEARYVIARLKKLDPSGLGIMGGEFSRDSYGILTPLS